MKKMRGQVSNERSLARCVFIIDQISRRQALFARAYVEREVDLDIAASLSHKKRQDCSIIVWLQDDIVDRDGKAVSWRGLPSSHSQSDLMIFAREPIDLL